VREAESDSMNFGFGDPNGRAVVIEESHGLRKDSLRLLLVTLERIPSHVVWCFTTSEEACELHDGTDLRRLLSRCIPLKMEASNLEFAKRCRKIALKEGLVRSGCGLSKFQSLAAECDGNCRQMLQRVATGECLLKS